MGLNILKKTNNMEKVLFIGYLKKTFMVIEDKCIFKLEDCSYWIQEDSVIFSNDNYIQKIKPQIDPVVKGPQGNTLRVKVSKDELIAYKNRVLSKPNAKNFKITLAQWVNYETLLTSTEANILRKKLKLYNDESAGQMTMITDCENVNGGNVQSLSGFDLMVPCPQDCP